MWGPLLVGRRRGAEAERARIPLVPLMTVLEETRQQSPGSGGAAGLGHRCAGFYIRGVGVGGVITKPGVGGATEDRAESRRGD